MERRPGVCTLGLGWCLGSLSSSTLCIRVRRVLGAVRREYTVSGQLGAGVFPGLALPNLSGHFLARQEGTLGKRRVLQRVVREALLCGRMIPIVRAIPSVPSLTPVVVVVVVAVSRRLGRVLRMVSSRRARGGSGLGARHVAGSRIRGYSRREAILRVVGGCLWSCAG